MRGGALVILIWLAIFVVFGLVDVFWTHDLVQIGMVAMSTGLTLSLITGIVLVGGPETLRRGEPRPRGPEVLVRRSFAAAFTGLGFAVFVSGFAFGRFPVYLGAGMVLAGGGRLIGEWVAQRRSREGRG